MSLNEPDFLVTKMMFYLILKCIARDAPHVIVIDNPEESAFWIIFFYLRPPVACVGSAHFWRQRWTQGHQCHPGSPSCPRGHVTNVRVFCVIVNLYRFIDPSSFCFRLVHWRSRSSFMPVASHKYLLESLHFSHHLLPLSFVGPGLLLWVDLFCPSCFGRG